MSANLTQGMLEVAETTSTMDLAREIVLAGRRDVFAVRADYQSEGRGRRGARWMAAPSESLLVTYILPIQPATQASAGRLAIQAGAAAALTIRDLAGADVRLKWPNDLLLADRKLGGILVEIPVPSLALVGVGVNLNTRVFPTELAAIAVSLRQHTGREWDVRDLARRVHAALVRQHAAPWEECLDLWRSLDVTAGRLYAATIENAEEVVTAVGVDSNGALWVRRATGQCVTVPSARSLA